MVSARGAVAADTRATAPPLVYPTEPGKVVALRSRWGSAGKKNRSNRLQWLGYWLADPGQPLKNQAQPVPLEVKARLTQWCISIPQQHTIGLTLEQQIADELGGNRSAQGAAERQKKDWEVLRDVARRVVAGL